MRPTLIDQVFDTEMLASVRASVTRVDNSVMRWEPDYNRFTYGDHEYFLALHAMMTEQVSQAVGEVLKPSYCLLAKYRNHGVVKMHRDRDCCYVTLSVKVHGPDWPMYIDGEAFVPSDNQGVLFRGAEQYHYRDPLVSDVEHCVLLFHYVPVAYEGEIK